MRSTRAAAGLGSIAVKVAAIRSNVAARSRGMLMPRPFAHTVPIRSGHLPLGWNFDGMRAERRGWRTSSASANHRPHRDNARADRRHGAEVCPGLHQVAAFVKKITAPVGRFDLVLDRVR